MNKEGLSLSDTNFFKPERNEAQFISEGLENLFQGAESVKKNDISNLLMQTSLDKINDNNQE